MRMSGSLYILVLVSRFYFLFAASPSVLRNKGNLFPLIGFLQGYKMGQNLGLQLPIVLSPLVVLPLNQDQSVYLHGHNENSTENGLYQATPSEKLKQHCNTSDIEANNRDDENNTLESNVELLEADMEEDAFRQRITTDTVTEANERTTMTPVTDFIQNTTFTDMETEKHRNMSKPYGPYPTAAYKNDEISTLTITEAPKHFDFMLPSTDDSWKNFTSKDTMDIEVKTRTGEVWTNDITYSKHDTREDSTYTNYYDAVKPNTDSYYRRPVYQSPKEIWNTIYSGDKLTSEFRPLAGLYYDGFLHRAPDKKIGFLPNGNTYY